MEASIADTLEKDHSIQKEQGLELALMDTPVPVILKKGKDFQDTFEHLEVNSLSLWDKERDMEQALEQPSDPMMTFVGTDKKREEALGNEGRFACQGQLQK